MSLDVDFLLKIPVKECVMKRGFDISVCREKTSQILLIINE